MRATATSLASVVAAGQDQLIVTHGNGPQVGALPRAGELAEREVPLRPLHWLGAETQGQIGFLVQEELTAVLAKARGTPARCDPAEPGRVNPRDPGVLMADQARGSVLFRDRGPSAEEARRVDARL